MREPRSIVRARLMRAAPSKAEKLLWSRLRAHRLNGWGFRRQAPVLGFVTDFLCHRPALIVEVDGPLHDEAEQIAFDFERTSELEREGFVVIRVRERVVRDGIDQVEAWITTVGTLILASETVPNEMRRLDRVPLP